MRISIQDACYEFATPIGVMVPVVVIMVAQKHIPKAIWKRHEEAVNIFFLFCNSIMATNLSIKSYKTNFLVNFFKKN
ncbi:MAG: hypothetical protein COZ76_10810 [Flavobacteriales bacterium CG_4_8_14_3_um_filter_35_10]|nr:MAG: hypothetical protein COZ76_10810 [Flavobacteriales bacterium CG_4_8_14_3_um_filter_35_10]